ncbi:MAG: hypothetical protein FJ279_36435, partial [Planctomycetes bacterium]|nr:hypothetical protein [Planctomycetota bacterium]
MKCLLTGGCALEGYVNAVLWDPRVLKLAADRSEVRLWLRPEAHQAKGAGLPSGISLGGVFISSKERIVIPTSVERRTLHLPHGLSLAYLKSEDGWQAVGTVGQHPAALVRRGAVVFAFDPTALIGRYLNMMDIGITADILDWMVVCVLQAGGHRARKPVAMWRDFHA